MEKINKNRIILLIIFIVLFFLSFYIYNRNFKIKEEDKNQDSEVKYKLLNDYSRFFTVNSCIYKYINYSKNEDIDSLLKILDKKYISDNKITSENIFNYVEKLNGLYSFTSKKIYYENMNEKYIKYYVYGYLTKEKIDSSGNNEDRYYEVTFDIKNYLFSIKPYDGSLFKEDFYG